MTTFLAALVLAAIIVAVVRLRGGRAPRLSPASREEVLGLIAEGKTVAAVKGYREITGLGLYDAKQAVDRIRATGVWEAPAASPAPPADAAVAALAGAGKIIEAVALYRETYGVDLTTAKSAVDKLAGR